MRISVQVDPNVLSRAERHSAGRGTSVSELLKQHLEWLGDRIISIALPGNDSHSHVFMLRDTNPASQAVLPGPISLRSFAQPALMYFFSWARLYPGLVIDGDANTGLYTLLAASASEANEVFAFEPDPSVRRYLELNVDANRASDRVHLVPTSLDEALYTAAAAYLCPQAQGGGDETISSELAALVSAHPEMDVTFAIDAVVRTNQHPVTLIRLKEGGYKPHVFSAVEHTAAIYRPVIFVELADAPVNLSSLLIDRHGYVDIPLCPETTPLVQSEATMHDSRTPTHALVPAEKVSDFLSLQQNSELQGDQI